MSDLDYAQDCAIMRFVDIFSGKWVLPIIYHLIHAHQAVRFSQLQKTLAPITQKELSKQLRLLEEHLLIKKTIYPEVPPRVEYEVTSLGQSLENSIQSLAQWMDDYEKQLNHLK